MSIIVCVTYMGETKSALLTGETTASAWALSTTMYLLGKHGAAPGRNLTVAFTSP